MNLLNLLIALLVLISSQNTFAREGWKIGGMNLGGGCDLEKYKGGNSTVEDIYSEARTHEQAQKPNLCKAAQAYTELKKKADSKSSFHETASYRLVQILFKDENYDGAITAARYYLAEYPELGEKNEEAQYILAVCFYSDRGTAQTDQDWTQKSQAHLSLYLKKYPEGKYVAEAKKMLETSYNEQAYKEINMARYYMKKGKHLSAALRLQYMFEHFRASSHTPEGLYLMVQCYRVLEREEEIKAVMEIFKSSFANTSWYAMTDDFLRERR